MTRMGVLKSFGIYDGPVHTVAENGETTATVAEFGDSRTFLRHCRQVLTRRTRSVLSRLTRMSSAQPTGVTSRLKEEGGNIIAFSDN